MLESNPSARWGSAGDSYRCEGSSQHQHEEVSEFFLKTLPDVKRPCKGRSGSFDKTYFIFRPGIAGGVLATTRNVGMVLGIALGAAILTARQAACLHLGPRH